VTHAHTRGKVPLDEGSTHHRKFYLTIQNTMTDVRAPGGIRNRDSKKETGSRPTP